MKSARITGATVFALLLFAATAAVATSITDDNVAAKIEAASSSSDHEALANYFDARAAAAAADGKRHERMRNAYSRGFGKPHAMRAHCQGLIRSNREASDEFSNLAELHRELAKQAK